MAAAALAALALTSGCGSEALDMPSAPTPVTSLVVGAPSPPSGATIRVTVGEPPGTFILPNSGQLSVPITVSSAREVPFAQLYVFLLSGDTYCGQNLPDTPSWSPFPAGRTLTFPITGFQVYRLPCEVTGLRVMLHTRNSGSLTPPTPAETVVESTLSVNYHLTR